MTNDTHALLRDGSLDQALDAAAAAVKTRPGDTEARALYAELLCFDGQFERADTQLETLLRLDPTLTLPVGTWRQLLRAAQARADVFERGATPALTREPTASIRTALKALTALRAGNAAEAAALCREAEATREAQARLVNGTPVSDIRDLDDLGAGYLEVLATNGSYYWVDMDDIASVDFEPPHRQLDLLWRPTILILADGTEGKVFVPTVYTTTAEDDAFKLGRETDWVEQHGLHRGVGQKMWLVGEEALPLQDITTLGRPDEVAVQQEAL